MKMREKLKTSIGKLRLKIAAGVAGISTGIMMMPVTAMANGNKLNANDAKTQVQNILKPILQFVSAGFGVVGAVFAFMGIWKVANAFRNDNNPEAISSGAKDIVVGALFIALGIIGATTNGFDFLFPTSNKAS